MAATTPRPPARDDGGQVVEAVTDRQWRAVEKYYATQLGSVMKQSWRRHAACFSTPTSVFFDDDKVDEAAAVCRGCTVRPACARWAMGEPSQQGFAGGLSEDERAAARTRCA